MRLTYFDKDKEELIVFEGPVTPLVLEGNNEHLGMRSNLEIKMMKIELEQGEFNVESWTKQKII